MVLTNEISGRSVGKNSQIIFHCYVDRCFLSELWSPAKENGRQLLTSRTEASGHWREFTQPTLGFSEFLP